MFTAIAPPRTGPGATRKAKALFQQDWRNTAFQLVRSSFERHCRPRINHGPSWNHWRAVDVQGRWQNRSPHMVDKTLNDLFLAQMKDIYYAEKEIYKTLPKMVKAAKVAELK